MIPERFALHGTTTSVKLVDIRRKENSYRFKVYKIMHSLTTVKFESFFEFDNYFRRRGHIYKLKKSFQRGSTSTFLLNVSCTRKFYSGLSHSNFRAQHPARVQYRTVNIMKQSG